MRPAIRVTQFLGRNRVSSTSMRLVMPVTMHDGRRSVQLLAAAELADREKRLVELVEIV